MRWGMAWGCAWSDPSTWIIILGITDLGSGLAVKFIIINHYSQYVQLVIDGVNSGPPILVNEGVVTTLIGNYVFPQGPHYVTVAGVGPYSTPDVFDVTAIQTAAANADRIHAEIVSSPTQFSTGDAGQLTAWIITGLVRFQNCRSAQNRPTWGELDITLATAVGVHTLTATLSGKTLWSGSRTGNGTINLATPAGVSVGSVVLTYSADFSTGALFISDWPSKYYVYYKLTNDWIANDFPAYATLTVSAASWLAAMATLTVGAHNWSVGTTIIISGVTPGGYNTTSGVLITAVTATTISYAVTTNPGAYISGGTITRQPTAIVYDDGKSASYGFETPPSLPVGTYHVVIHEVSDTNVESTGTVNGTQAIVHVPAAPALPIYVSGGAAATVISWAAVIAPDAAATYNLYDSLDVGVISPDIKQTHAAGAGTLTLTLAAISGTFTGTRYIVLRSLLAGIESGNSIAAQIQYIAGVVTVLRPNTPNIGIITTVTRTLTVKWSLDTNSAKIAATQVQLFLATSPTTFNYAAPDGTVSVPAVTPSQPRIVFGTVAATAGADGEYWFAIRANSANGQSLNVNYLGPIRLASAAPSDPVVTIRGGV